MTKKVIVEISEDMYSKICDFDGRHDLLRREKGGIDGNKEAVRL